MSWNDPIVDEIHQVRQQIMQEHDNDLHKLFEHLRKSQEVNGRSVVSRPPKTPDTMREQRSL